MKRMRVPARNPALGPLGRWLRNLRPEMPRRYLPCTSSSSASYAPACEEAIVQVLGLHIAGLTDPPLYRESSWHQGRALLNYLHPPRESGGRRGHVSSSRKVVRARDCPARRGTNEIVPLSGVRMGFIASSRPSYLRQGSDDEELVPNFGASLRRGYKRSGRSEERKEE
jgi:hypothetical protein